MAWLSALPQLIGAFLVLFLPGALLLFTLGLPKFFAFAFSPVIVATFTAFCGTFFPFVNLPFNPYTLGISYLLLQLLALLRLALKRKHGKSSPTAQSFSPYLTLPVQLRWQNYLNYFLVVLCLLALCLPFLHIDPQEPLHRWDPIMHANAVQLIEETQRASYFDSFTQLYGIDTSPTNYMAGWHGLVSLVATSHTVIPAINSFNLLANLIWVSGLLLLALVLGFSTHQRSGLLIAATGVFSFPTLLFSAYPPLPNAFSNALLPAFLAGIIASGRYILYQRCFLSTLTQLLIFALLGVSLVLIHPISLLSLAILILPLLPLALFHAYKQLFHTRRQRFLYLGALSGIFLATFALLLGVPFIRNSFFQMFRNTNARNFNWNNFSHALTSTLLARPDFALGDGGIYPFCAIAVCIFLAGALILGIITVHRIQQFRWITLSYLFITLLVFTAFIQMGPLLSFASLWYAYPNRLLAVQAIPLILLGGIGISTALEKYESQRKKKGRKVSHKFFTYAALISMIIASLLTFPVRFFLVSYAWGETKSSTNIMSKEELAMIRHLPQVLPKNALVLGEPLNGSAYVMAISGIDTVYPQGYIRPSNYREIYVSTHLSAIDSDPRVCELINELKITHIYYDRARGGLMGTRLPTVGLNSVDLNKGFTKVAEGGSAAVYRIDACKHSNSAD